MVLIRKPFQIVNIKKFIIFTILTGMTIASYIYQEFLQENLPIERILRDLYDTNIINASLFDILTENIGLLISGFLGAILILYFLHLLYHIIYLKKTTYKFDFDTNNITIEEGIFSKYQDGLSMHNIVDIDMSQNFIEMLFKKHTLRIYTRGDLTQQSKKGLTRAELQNIENINQNIEFGYVGLKKFLSIKNAEEVFEQLRNKLRPVEID
jgi:membrane protein YdbS with pleckstrin-like domain